MSFDEYYVYGDQKTEVPAHLNFAQYILDGVRQYEDEVALVNATTGDELTYGKFAQYTVTLAASLSKLGIGKNDVVAIVSEKCNTFVPTVLGVILTGATCTLYSSLNGKAVLGHHLSIAKPKYFICSKLFWDLFEEVLAPCDSIKAYITFDNVFKNAITIQSLLSKNIDIKKFESAKIFGQIDTALILYSSGTTGLPKGVCLTHHNCILNSLQDNNTFYNGNQTAFIFGEWYHNYDIFMTCKLLCDGKKMVYINDSTIPNILECVDKYQVDMMFVIPHLVNLLVKEEYLKRYNLNSLKIIYSRASPLQKNTIEKVKQRLPNLQKILQGYGMTECGEPASEKWAVKGLKPGSIGMAAPSVMMKVVEPETNVKLGPNQLGEIRVKGPMLMKEYINIDSSTYLDEEGFYKTGDIGYYDEDEYFYIVDRIKDIINNKGQKLSPVELEMLLERHQSVLEAAVVGKPDFDSRELPTAFVVKILGSNVTEQEIIDYVNSEVPPFMQLKGGVKFIDKLPRSPRGKLLRRKLREMFDQFS